MLSRWTGNVILLLSVATGTSMVAGGNAAEPPRWRSPSMAPEHGTDGSTIQLTSLDAEPDSTGLAHASLPSEHGQVYREYDIRPYTSRVDSPNPQQDIVDWILRETGTEAWLSEPLAILNPQRDRLRVYHTPQIQEMVSDIVDRFVVNANDSYVFGFRMMTVGSPNWRAKAQPVLRPVAVQTDGVEAWILSKEDEARLVADLRKRSDTVEHSSPNLLLFNGQTHSITHTRPLPYIRSVQNQPTAWAGHQMQMGQIEEGISVQLSPLLSRDRTTVDAVLRLKVSQLEKFVSVWVNVPTALDPRQRTQIQVPQTSRWELHERFRWPANQVLLISCGVIPAPSPARPKTTSVTALFGGASRADALILVEAKGPAGKSGAPPPVSVRTGNLNYRGRY